MSTSAAIGHNVGVLRRVSAPAAVVAVVKADGYGHGASPVAAAALDAGATAARRRHRRRGRRASRRGHRRAHPRARRAPSRRDAGVRRLRPRARRVHPHGHRGGRQGGRRPRPAPRRAPQGRHRHAPRRRRPWRRARARRGGRDGAGAPLASVWTHCAVADEPDDPYTAEQLARYDAVLAELAARGIDPGERHAANSAAAFCHPAARYDVVRAGIATYGIAPAPASRATQVWSSFVPRSRGRPRSRSSRPSPPASASATGCVTVSTATPSSPPCPWATPTVVPRRWTRRRRRGARRRPAATDRRRRDDGPAHGRLRSRRRPHGRRRAVPVAGDRVVLLGEQGGEAIRPDEWAARLDTIAYEIVCGIGPRVPRRYA